MKRLLILVLLLSNIQLLTGQDFKLIGHWQGVLNFSGREIDIIVSFHKKEGQYQGMLSSQKQQLKDLPMSEIWVTGDSLQFLVPMAGGKWEGAFDNGALKGNWIQGPYKMPLVFQRMEEKPQLAIKERSQTPKPPFPYSEEEVVYHNALDQTKLAATLTIPKGQGPFPAAILLTVAGPNDRNQMHGSPPHKPYQVLADHLSRNGIAVLRADDRGVGGSSGDLFQSNIADFAEDAKAGFNYLKTRKEVDQSKIGFIGNSEGTLVGPLAASQLENVAFIVTLGGIGITGGEVILDQAAGLGPLAGMMEDQIVNTQKRTRQLFSILRQEKDSLKAAGKIRSLVQKNEGTPKSNLFLLPQSPEEQIRLFTSPWYRYQIDYDPAPVLQQLKCPFLALHGDIDPFVLPDKNLEAIAQNLRKGGNEQYAIIKLKSINHVFQDATSGSPLEYNKNETSFSPRALKLILHWLEVVLDY